MEIDTMRAAFRRERSVLALLYYCACTLSSSSSWRELMAA